MLIYAIYANKALQISLKIHRPVGKLFHLVHQILTTNTQVSHSLDLLIPLSTLPKIITTDSQKRHRNVFYDASHLHIT